MADTAGVSPKVVSAAGRQWEGIDLWNGGQLWVMLKW